MGLREWINLVEASNPSLTPALIVRGKVIKARSKNDTHNNIYRDLPERLQQAFDTDAAHYEKVRGYIDHRGRYLNGYQALQYAEENDLIDTERMRREGVRSMDFLVTEFLKKQ